MRVRRDTICALAAMSLVAACGRAGTAGGKVFFSELPLGVSPSLPVPAGNPLVCERVKLGRRLFFDTRLSRGGAVACATCHVPKLAFTDGRQLPIGDGGAVGRRNAPTLLNRAYGHSQFWDGRVATLEAQVTLPLANPRELANSRGEIERRLSSDHAYRRQFVASFGSTEVTLERVSLAIASFVRTIVSGDAPVDRFLERRDSSALTPEARRGFELFRGKAACITCHEPPRFTDERFHNTGVAWKNGAYADSGRFEVTRRLENLGAFKTPTLRNVAVTAPYMHDGSVGTLREIIEFYDGGGKPNPHIDPLVRRLDLTSAEKAELLAFLEALTGTVVSAKTAGCSVTPSRQ